MICNTQKELIISKNTPPSQERVLELISEDLFSPK
jgi:hypothetical protein